jgi:hypothetical protein
VWYVDADEDSSAGQEHGAVGGEFNVRVVIGETCGGGWVDVTGGMVVGRRRPNDFQGGEFERHAVAASSDIRKRRNRPSTTPACRAGENSGSGSTFSSTRP